MGLSALAAVGTVCLVAGLVSSGCTAAGIGFSCRCTEQGRLCTKNYGDRWSHVKNAAALLLEIPSVAQPL